MSKYIVIGISCSSLLSKRVNITAYAGKLMRVLHGVSVDTTSPLTTYGGKGCAKPEVIKWQHAIAYTGHEEPKILPGEQPAIGEYGMMSAIRVRPVNKEDKLGPPCRINFGKFYNVEHTVKVYDFGAVHEDYMSKLIRAWEYVFNSLKRDNDHSEYDEDNIKIEDDTEGYHDDNEGYESQDSERDEDNATEDGWRSEENTYNDGDSTSSPPQLVPTASSQERKPLSFFGNTLSRQEQPGKEKMGFVVPESRSIKQSQSLLGGLPSDRSTINQERTLETTVSNPFTSSHSSTDLKPDVRLTCPGKWFTTLETMEGKVARSSGLVNHVAQAGDILSIERCLELLDVVCLNLDRMRDFKYSDHSMTFIINSIERPGVASLKNVSKDDVEMLKEALHRDSLDRLKIMLIQFGFTRIGGTEHSYSENSNGYQRMATLLTRFLDLAVVSFAGAHLEDFPTRYAKKPITEIILVEGIILRKRTLRCLDGMLYGQRVWVFEELENPEITPVPDLCISTTVNDLAQTWGPAWTISQKNKPSGITRIGIRNGFITPHSDDKGQFSVERTEILSHWAAKSDQTEQETISIESDPEPFPDDIMTRHLLIGAGERFIVNQNCPAEADKFTRRVKLDERLGEVLTPRYRSPSENVITTQIGGPFGNVGLEHKIGRRIPSSFRDDMLFGWEMDSHRRNPRQLQQKLGIEISDCTGNARRRSLIYLLRSPTIRNYLKSILFDWPDNCEDSYFQALSNKDEETFPKLYELDEAHRRIYGDAIYQSLRILFKTRLDEDDCLSSLWAPTHHRMWTVRYYADTCAWNSFLRDSETRFTVAITERICFEFICGPHKTGCRNIFPRPTAPPSLTFLETMLDINEAYKYPKRLGKGSTNEGQPSSGEWPISNLCPSDTFDLGHGKLVVIKVLSSSVEFSQSGLVVSWNIPLAGLVQKGTDSVRRKWLHKPPARRHSEADGGIPYSTPPIPIFIASKSKIGIW
jgi:hypothetical protein